MDKIAAITKIIEALAWPLVVLILGVIFKSEVSALSRRVRGVKGWGGEVTLDSLIEEKKSAVIQQSELVIDAQSMSPDKRDSAVEKYKRAKEQLDFLIKKRQELTLQLQGYGPRNMTEDLVQFVVTELGLGRISNMSTPQLIAEWPLLSRIPNPSTGLPLNGGLMTGLRAVGVCTADNGLTPTGADILIVTAKQIIAATALSKQSQ